MCVILAKKMNVKMPDMETLKACWDNNPDGAGVMYSDGHGVTFKKGFMTWESFRRYWLKFTAIDRTKTAVAVHFRIATHGTVNGAMCHPFPVTFNEKELVKTSGAGLPIAVMHNGIIGLTGHDYKSPLSDTALFIRDYLSALYDGNDGMLRNDSHRFLIELLAGSKLAFIESDGAVSTIGEFIDRDGILYSNSSFKVRKVYAYDGYTSKDWDAFPRYHWDNGLHDYVKSTYLEKWDAKNMTYRKYYYDAITNGYTSLTPEAEELLEEVADEKQNKLDAYYGDTDGYNYNDKDAPEYDCENLYNDKEYCTNCERVIKSGGGKADAVIAFLEQNAPEGSGAMSVLYNYYIDNANAISAKNKKCSITTVPPTKEAPYKLVNGAKKEASNDKVLQNTDTISNNFQDTV